MSPRWNISLWPLNYIINNIRNVIIILYHHNNREVLRNTCQIYVIINIIYLSCPERLSSWLMNLNWITRDLLRLVYQINYHKFSKPSKHTMNYIILFSVHEHNEYNNMVECTYIHMITAIYWPLCHIRILFDWLFSFNTILNGLVHFHNVLFWKLNILVELMIIFMIRWYTTR